MNREYKIEFLPKEQREGTMIDDDGRDVMPARQLYAMHLLMARRIINNLRGKSLELPIKIEIGYDCFVIMYEYTFDEYDIKRITECFSKGKRAKQEQKYWRWFVYTSSKQELCIHIYYDYEEEMREMCPGI